MSPRHEPARPRIYTRLRHPLRLLGSLTLFGLAAVLVPAIAGAVMFSAVLVDNVNTFATGSLVWSAAAAGASTCVTTGPTITTDTATCAGSPLPTATLSTTASSATTTVSSVGSLTSTTSTAAVNGCGVQSFNDAATTSSNTGIPFYGVTYGTTMSVLSSTAATFNGTTGWAETLTQQNDPKNFSVAGWFNTTHATGTIVGFSDTQYNSGSANNDREIWIDGTGHLVWATRSSTGAGTRTELISPSTYDNGAWHYVVATISTTNGDRLYVDGALVASSAGVTAARNYDGYWTLGWGSEVSGGGWANLPSNAYFNGSLAGVAVFPAPLNATQVSALYSATTQSAYDSIVVSSDAATSYWPLDDTGTTPYIGSLPTLTAGSPTLADISGNANTGTSEGTVALGASGPLSGNAITLPGTSGSLVNTTTSYTYPDADSGVLSQSVWFKTSTSGAIMGFTSEQTDATPSTYDRMFWIDATGHLVYSVYSAPITGSYSEVTSPGVYDTGTWYQATATVGPSGEILYVDGEQVASAPAAVTAQNFTGYWHIGYAYTSGWADAPASDYFAGSIAHAAVYPTQLTPSQVASIYTPTTVAGEESAVMALSPTSYWPLTDTSSSPVCGLVEITVDATASGSSTCVFPARTSACPAPSVADYVENFTSGSMPNPASSAPVTLLTTLKLATAAPTGVAGLHLLVPLTLSSADGGFTNQLSYASAVAVL